MQRASSTADMGNVKIGALTLRHGLMLAPMAGVTDASFRAICRQAGAEYTVSEMISAKALCFEQKGRDSAPAKTAALATIREADAPMAIQLFGSEPDFMREAALLIEAGSYRGAVKGPAPAAIDINMGCPVAKVVSNGEGSALMRDPTRAAAIVSAVKSAVKLPVTVKIRAGWDEQHKNAVEFAKRMEEAGADLICVHGRTRQQFYAPKSDNGVIAAVKAAVSVPVIGNGDIFTPDDALHMLSDTGCDGVMIARGALGNPFLFTALTARLQNTPYTPPTVRQRIETALAHAADMIEKKGARIGVAEARKHMAWYCHGLRGAAAARGALMHAESLIEFTNILGALVRDEETL
ncbi:MAG: tRNA dihydrouridine synthase DusB [Clostridia bacterium]|nr:tRNA dihydrouridine synthase DusB [Clostridia bacterium]